MPCVGLNCEEKGKVRFEECLKCQNRCMSERTVRLFQKITSRLLTGKSITQLLLPTRMLYLMMTRDYYEKPKVLIDRTIGWLAHQRIDWGQREKQEEKTGICDRIVITESKIVIHIRSNGLSKKKKKRKETGKKKTVKKRKTGILSEKHLEDSKRGMEGTIDTYDGDLYDVKVCGAYAAAKALKGEVDLPWCIQLNYYRILLESHGYPVRRMFIEPWVKDSASIARRYGISKKPNLIEINRISDWWIDRWIRIKRDRLEQALRSGKTMRCRRTWKGKRCATCPVLEFCQEMEE